MPESTIDHILRSLLQVVRLHEFTALALKLILFSILYSRRFFVNDPRHIRKRTLRFVLLEGRIILD